MMYISKDEHIYMSKFKNTTHIFIYWKILSKSMNKITHFNSIFQLSKFLRDFANFNFIMIPLITYFNYLSFSKTQRPVSLTFLFSCFPYNTSAKKWKRETQLKLLCSRYNLDKKDYNFRLKNNYNFRLHLILIHNTNITLKNSNFTKVHPFF